LHHRVQGLGAVVGGRGGLVQQEVELLAGAEDGLQRKHGGLRDTGTTGWNYDGWMTGMRTPGPPGGCYDPAAPRASHGRFPLAAAIDRTHRPPGRIDCAP